MFEGKEKKNKSDKIKKGEQWVDLKRVCSSLWAGKII